MDEKYLINAYKHSRNNFEELKSSNRCGCFYCMKIFDKDEVVSWINDDTKTGICPYCNTDALLGDSSEYEISHEFLKKMNQKWFK